MLQRVSERPIPRSTCPQALLIKSLAAVIHESARQVHPAVFQDIVRGVGVEQGRLAASEWRSTHGASRRRDIRLCVQCLKAVGQQCGWNLQVTVDSDEAWKISVIECGFTEPKESGLYLCDLPAGLFAGVAVEILGYARSYISHYSETPPLHCDFTIDLQESTAQRATSNIVYPRRENESVLFKERALDSAPGDHLTQRELQVLQLIAHGFSDKQIAQALQRSVRTVENHAARIRQKLDIGSRTRLVRFALRSGLVEF